MHLFYAPEIAGNTYQLSEEESKHCLRVLRLAAGDVLHLTDGRGTLFTAKITDNHPKHCVVKVEQTHPNYQPRPYYLHLAVAPTKNMDRYEWMLEKIAEIGVDEITPLICEHSERRIWKRERADKILVAAMKQSLKVRLPKLNEAVSFADFAQQSFDGKKLIAHCGLGERMLFSNTIQQEKNILVSVGPEGDFSIQEINKALAAGYTAVSLGDSRLRTETAGVVACAAIYMQKQP